MVVFVVISIITITSRVLELDDIQNVFKPMLMPILMLFLFVNTKLTTTFSKLLFFALLFSMAGDVFLMPYFDIFLFGLASFLVAHIFYIAAFLRNNNLLEGIKKNMIMVVILILAYLGLIFILVSNMHKSGIDTVMIAAVVVYASVITVMVITTMAMYGNRPSIQSKLMMMGAILFMLSDSVIAVNKFVLEIPLSGLWIMTTYTLAQWLITVGGILKDKGK